MDYEVYANQPCSEIPIDHLKGFILTFLTEASKDMGQEFDRDNTPDRVYYIIDKHYNHLPLMLVASAFKRGSLGQYGPGRLVPRTIYGWMAEMNQYLMTKHEVRDSSQDRKHKYDGLEKYPLGSAIIKKIDWLTSGAITMDQWDEIPLRAVAEMIGQGHTPTLAKFGINNEEL